MRKKVLLLFAAILSLWSVMAQGRKISGKITDGTGSPLAGASVLVKGTNNGTSTDASGNFQLTVSANAKTLVISAVGFETETVSIGSGSNFAVSLKSTAGQEISEVVVTAGGIVKRKSEVGAAQTSVSGAAVTKSKSVNIAGGLVAKVAGLQIQGTTGGVNPNYRIILRGNRSLTGNNEALIVLDNVIVPNSVLSNLNPEDIETYNILQGASAAALYGSQASNGAIIITTKKGKSGTTSVRIAQTESFEQPAFFPKNQLEYGQGGSSYGYDAFGRPNFSSIENQSYGPHFDGSTRPLGDPLENGSQETQLYSPNNSRKQFWKMGLTSQTDFSVSSGDALSTLYLSGQLATVKGTTPKDRYNRYTLRINGTRKIYGDKLNASYSLGYTQNNYDITTRTGTIYNDMLNMPSNIDITRYANWKTDPYANPNGYYNPWYLNPYWEIDNYRQATRNEYLIGNVELRFTPITGLSFVARQGMTKTNQYNKSWNNSFDYTSYAETISSHTKTDISAGVSDGENYNMNLISDLFFQAKKTFNKFSGELIGGGQWTQNVYKGVGVSASPLVVPDLYNVSNLVGIPGASESNYLARVMGAYGSLQLGYDDYLFLHMTGRNDWNSTLPQASRSFFYPSADVSFVANKALDFIKNSKTIDYLRLRAGVSKVGNVNLGGTFGAYQLQRTFSQQNGFPYGSLAGFGLDNTLVSPTLKPELTQQYEFGFDLDMFKRRLTSSFTWYHSITNNQTVRTGISGTSGATSYLTNVGSTMSQGLEAAIHYTAIRTRDLQITIGGNYTYLDNKVKEISADIPRLSLATYGDGSGIYAIPGQPFPVIMGKDYVRDSEGHVIVNSSTGEPTIDQTLKILGNSVAKHRIGLDLDVRYKGFELTTVMEYRGGYQMYFGAGGDVDWAGTGIRTIMFNRGRFVFPNSVYADPANPGKYIKNTNVTIVDGGGNAGFWTSDNNRAVSANYVSSGAFWKMRELSISYTVPQKALAKLKAVKSIVISAQGRNLFFILPATNYYTDSEYSEVSSTSNGVGITGISSGPPSRYFGGTVSLTF